MKNYFEGNYSVGKRRNAEDFNDNSPGDSIDKLCWGLKMNSAGGIERTLLRMIFLLQLTEDNPVRLWWG